jgi:hypothetical protein
MSVVSGELSVSIVKVVSVVISGQECNGQVKSGHESGQWNNDHTDHLTFDNECWPLTTHHLTTGLLTTY